MSTFAGLNTAHLGLNAARRGMEVAGQNIANQETPGYTRQRVEQSSVAPVSGGTTHGKVPGGGVSITGIARTGDVVLDARAREATASQAYWDARSAAASHLESFMAEPTEQGLSHAMSGFWASWQDLANSPDSSSAASVVLSGAETLAAQIASGYTAAADHWSQVRGSAQRNVEDINTAAREVASLNDQVRDALASGRSANELIDARDLIVADLSRMTGATGTVEKDGSMTVRIDGNPLVQGDMARELVLTGGTDVASGEPVTVAWAHRPGSPIQSMSGSLGGNLSALAPASDGGVLAQAAAAYNDVATELAVQVNAQHQAGVTSGGDPAGPFFSLSADGAPAALSLAVVPQNGSQLATGSVGGGALDARNADAISQIGEQTGSPSDVWSSFVVRLGATAASDNQKASVSGIAAVAAVAAQRSVASVDGDEETINLMTMQTAYQANARVLTAIDEALDILINRTGLVGR